LPQPKTTENDFAQPKISDEISFGTKKYGEAFFTAMPYFNWLRAAYMG